MLAEELIKNIDWIKIANAINVIAKAVKNENASSLN